MVGLSPVFNSQPPRKALTFRGPWRDQEAQVRRMIREQDVQSHLRKNFDGAFIWHVMRWKSWIQVKIDRRGNREADAQKTAAWFAPLKEGVEAYLSGLIPKEMGELRVVAEPWIQKPFQYGGCCRKGCDACLIGAPKKEKPEQPMFYKDWKKLQESKKPD